MKSLTKIALIAGTVYLALTTSAFASYCYMPSDIGSTTYQIQRVIAYQEGDKYELQVDVVNLMCTESYGSYRWQPTNPLGPVTRRAMDGSLYTINNISGQSVLTTESYSPIQSNEILNQQFQTFVYKFSVKAIFGRAYTVRLRFNQNYKSEILQDGKVVRPPTEASIGETYIDVSR